MDRWAQPVPLQRLADVPTWFDSFDSSGVPGAMPQVMEPFQAPAATWMIRMFKTRPCNIDGEHDHRACPWYHSEREKRRPVLIEGSSPAYYSVPCELRFDDEGICPKGDLCDRCHSNTELLYHPDLYKKRFCHQPRNCARGKFCAFAHSREELLAPYFSPEEENHPTEEFMAHHFKTQWCPIGGPHDWEKCVYAHTYRDFRRVPALGNAADTDYLTRCPLGFTCPLAHGAKEQLYHPRFYKANPCSDRHCRRRVLCAFTHGEAPRIRVEHRRVNQWRMIPDAELLLAQFQPNFARPPVYLSEDPKGSLVLGPTQEASPVLPGFSAPAAPPQFVDFAGYQAPLLLPMSPCSAGSFVMAPTSPTSGMPFPPNETPSNWLKIPKPDLETDFGLQRVAHQLFLRPRYTGGLLAIYAKIRGLRLACGGTSNSDLLAAAMRRGFLELMDTMPQAMKMDFAPYIEQLFPPMLMGITGDKDQNEDPGHRAALALVQRFGDLCPDRLLDGFEGTYCRTLQHDSPEEASRNAIVREKNAVLLGKVAEKILEHKKFGQDLLTTEDCSNKATRERVLVLIFLARYDADASVKRVANGLWKTAGGAPKVQKAIMPSVSKTLQKFRGGSKGPGAQKLALEVLDQLVKAGELEAIEEAIPEAPKFQFPPSAERAPENSLPALVISGKEPEVSSQDSQSGGKVDASQLAAKAREEMTSNKHLSKLVPCVRDHLGAIGASIVVEGQKNKHFHGRKQVATLAEDVTTALTLCNEVGEAPNADDVPGICEAVVRAAMGDAFDAHADGGNDDDEMLLRVENLLLMYGAGHLLLKDTTLEMRQNCRYGVVGHNGAGKTTLMKEIAAHRIVGMPPDLKCVHVDDSKLGEMSKSYLTALEYCIKMAKDIGVNDAGRDTLLKVGFDEAKLNDPVSELSTGWRMRLTLAVSMLKHADLVLLDEPTNHLDEESVRWLSDYILSITSSSVMVISHEPKFLNKICTHVVAYVDKKLEYTEGNFDIFAQKKGLSREQIDSMLSGNLSFDTKKEGEDEEEGGDVSKVSAPVAGPPKLTFPIPGSMEGVKTGSKSVLEIKHVSFRFSKDKDYLFQDCTGKLSLSSRVAVCGRNGCGKSTLMTLLCSELHPSDNKDGGHGEVWRHHNLRLAYMKQDHLKALGPFFDTSPFVYITERFKDGYDGDLQKRLIEPEDEEDALRRKELAKQHGKYGNEVAELVSRTKVGNHLAYEVRWDGLDDPKQNTVEPISKLKAMGLDKVIIACDERIAAKAAGLDQRPLTRREIVRHCEAFGIDEEMCCNRQIRGFSAGQKVRLSLAAMFWTKPHFIALDEPTNYLDVETVDALGKALTNFRGGIIMIEPKSDFVERICNEKWVLEDGVMKHEKLNNGVKRQA
ncbi:TEF3 [Symbiodinium sp. CCMP2592]|nr:TEF3 [Symbiodinium sp. CCMP2592]